MRKGGRIRGIWFSVWNMLKRYLTLHPNAAFTVSLLLCAIIIPVILSIALSPIKDSSSSGAIWVEFWGSFLGALIGAAITYLVMYRTFTENNKNNKTERDSSFKLHRAETLRNDYREQSKCINHFVDVIQSMISNLDSTMFPKEDEIDKTDIILKRNVIEIKAGLKKAYDAIFDIPISDKPAKTYLHRIEKMYGGLISAIETYSSSVSNTFDYIKRMAEEDMYKDTDLRFIETSTGLTLFDTTILADVFSLIKNRYTDNLFVYNTSEILNGWNHVNDNDSEFSYKQIKNIDGIFLVTSPLLVKALFLSYDDKKLYDAYRHILLKFARQLDNNPNDANIKNFETCLEKYINKITFDNLLVIPIVITRNNSVSTYRELKGEEEITPIVLTDRCKKMIRERFKARHNYMWSIDEQDSKLGCKFEIDNELRTEIFGYEKDDCPFDNEDSVIDNDSAQFTQYMDFLFMDITHPELNLFLLYPTYAYKILRIPLLIEEIHKRFHFAVKEELLSLTSLEEI